MESGEQRERERKKVPTLFSSKRPSDKQVVKVASEGGVVQSKVGGASEREKSGGYSARSTT